MPDARVWPGSPHPLGATWDGEGVNFALFSEHATAVELCIFDGPSETVPSIRVDMPEATDRVWHVYLPDVRPGAFYGYRVDGPWAPDEGHRFNKHKLLIDPYAKAISSAITWSDEVYGYKVGDPGADLVMDDRDSAPHIPKSIVIDQAFTWGDDRPPRTPWNQTLIYECHVHGYTMLHPHVPEHLRGTFLGLASDSVLDHLTALGVSAVELMPTHHFVHDRHLVDEGLTNFWGYNSIGFFAPHSAYATPGLANQVSEFKSMVKAFHRAGIEVILDVVYNHTGEGNHLGPTLSMRGVDNSVYYRLDPEHPRYHIDFTGTGNSLNILHPRTMALIMDSLRYWVTDMHVDGFRFDLAPTLTRGYEEGRPSAFFEIIEQDPILSQVKLIAEPWDVGPDGYQLGKFHQGWAEWNGAYRDSLRRFWRGDDGQVPELASRLAGSSDIYAPSGRRTYASVNFVTCHDGFTLTDLVSYAERHNWANGEQNHDGASENYSTNWGEEGETENQRILRLRERMKRNLLASLMTSQGVRMLLAGDEFGRSQQGNNNPYCQDNEISWVYWGLDDSAQDLLAFTKALVSIFRENPVLRRRDFFSGRGPNGEPSREVRWIRADGNEMGPPDWANNQNKSVGMMIFGSAADEIDDRGRTVRGDTVLLLLNAGARSRSYQLPETGQPGIWEELLNTALPFNASQTGRRVERHDSINLAAHSTILLRRNERGGP